MIQVEIIPILQDNYAYFIESSDGTGAIIDPGEAAPIIDFFEKSEKKPDFIINTHHHWDHVNGNTEIKAKYDCKIIAPQIDAAKIKSVDQTLADGEIFKVGADDMHIILTPGHTTGGICLYFKDSGILFTGDTLFSMGCGRLFEGTAQDMFRSFQKIATLPDETLIYCGHEYTKSNGMFALSLNHKSEDLKSRMTQVDSLRAKNKPTVPVTLKIEKQTNPFLKAKSAEEFSTLRERKDNF